MDLKNIIVSKSKYTLLVFNSKYSDNVTRAQLDLSVISYFASCRSDWFKKISTVALPYLESSGDFAVLYNETNKEALTAVMGHE